MHVQYGNYLIATTQRMYMTSPLLTYIQQGLSVLYSLPQTETAVVHNGD